MRRKKLSEIISKEDRQELLNYLLTKELERIRKKIYKYQRRDVVWNPITIEEKDLTELKAAGQYEWDKDSEVHKIYIETRIIDEYLSNNYSRWYRKKYAKKQLVNTIGHEITHALVKEKFEHIFRNIEEKNRDGSPVFLATLQFLEYSSNHRCATNYFCSQVWRDVQDLKSNKGTWDEFINYIFFYLQEINDIREKYNKEHQLSGQSISFKFSSRGTGLRKMSKSTLDVKAYVTNKREFRNMCVTSTTFEIGSGIYPEKIKKLLPKKLNNEEKADINIIQYKKLICNDETKYTKWLYEKEETYNKYAEQKTAQIIK